MFLFIFEGLGTSELLMILIVALVIFGPRKLPQLSRSLGKSLADFRRASEDFKQTWEKEVAREGSIKEALLGDIMPGEDHAILGDAPARTSAVLGEDDTARNPHETYADSTPQVSTSAAQAPWPSSDPSAIARGGGGSSTTATKAPEAAAQEAPEPTRKRDWL